ncbi:hypothetical protein R1flu_017931 [Riccia fluitans]|uniref:phosphoglycerate mutase (2,3-diphosphoglycerate-independent) n=1 Tax=Riccia fluitans TaxID=41844 RepID=A0ABD1ZEL9_9MARC
MRCCGFGATNVVEPAKVDWRLLRHPVIKRGTPFLLCVLDGWGENVEDDYNGIYKAQVRTIRALKDGAPKRWRTIRAHGTAVGLPSDDDMGNSEVGHNAMGAGKIIEQGAGLVDTALRSEKLYNDKGFSYIKEAWFNAPGTQHFIGLISDGGVHSRYDQLAELMKGCAQRGCKKIRVHGLTDGRDCAEGSSIKFFTELEKDLEVLCKQGCDARVASGGGRMYVTMDRYEAARNLNTSNCVHFEEADWKIVERGWQAHVLGEAPNKFTNSIEAIETIRKKHPETNDQYMPPFVIVDKNGAPVGPIQDGDAVVIFNFRADRVVELSKAFEYEDFKKFDRKRWPKVKFVGMMQYDGDLKLPKHYLVSPPLIERVSGTYLVKNGVRTFACSETQKFGHVTFFWNGNRSGKLDHNFETYQEIVSDNCPFNEKPKMKAEQIAKVAKEAILSGYYDYIRVNLANGDMVGHTGDLGAVLTACATVDKAVKVMLDAIEKVGGIYMITADHGNADDMAQRDKKGKPLKDTEGNVIPLTSHTFAPVPCAIGGPGLPPQVEFRSDLPSAGLANVTATYMNLLGFEAPADYEPTLLKW